MVEGAPESGPESVELFGLMAIDASAGGGGVWLLGALPGVTAPPLPDELDEPDELPELAPGAEPEEPPAPA
jgi:hypothetical protein